MSDGPSTPENETQVEKGNQFKEALQGVSNAEIAVALFRKSQA